jgi:hypothetical protein
MAEKDVKSFTLDWKGWWLLRTPISDVPELKAKCCVYAVMGAKLQKVKGGVGSSGREPILFNVYRGAESAKDHFLKLQKMSLGVFAANRAKEINKHAIVYLAPLPDDTDLGDLASILSLLYGAVPYAPKHHAMPPKYAGENFHIKNAGRNPGLPEEMFHREKADSDKPHDPDATHDGGADAAMTAAIAAEAQATRRLSQHEMDVRGIATEKVAKPQHQIPTEKLDKDTPKLVETTKVKKEDIGGLATERVPKPPPSKRTEFVAKPDAEPADEPTVLDEAGA